MNTRDYPGLSPTSRPRAVQGNTRDGKSQVSQLFPGVSEPYGGPGMGMGPGGLGGGFGGGYQPGPGGMTGYPPTVPVVEEAVPVVVVPKTAAELVETASDDKSSIFSMEKLQEIKGFVDRMGGIDGILGTVTKVQKVMSSVSQMAPLVKVIMGSFGKSGKGATVSDDEGGEWTPPKKRRKRKPGSGGKAGGAAGGVKRRRKPVKRPR
ncbi:hypothetical protein ACFO9Q_15210 [Paenibacillus sp. GCM10023252]|uniref:hypothetical protein n=1 Tax=Paenibacillus sp. GCM10023252 TaxID=3252649 RepID=UPI0036161C24